MEKSVKNLTGLLEQGCCKPSRTSHLERNSGKRKLFPRYVIHIHIDFHICGKYREDREKNARSLRCYKPSC